MSPINNVTNRAPQRLVIGHLHKGERQPPPDAGGKRRSFAKDLPGYFRFESRFPDMPVAFAGKYGDQPRSLLCILDGDTTDEALDAWYESYTASGTLQHRCDGERIVFLRDRDRPSGVRWALGEGPACPYAGLRAVDRKAERGACSQRGRLKVLPCDLLPDGRPVYARGLTRVGQIVVVTYAIFDILHLADVLNAMVEQHGRLRGIPFTLGREQRPIPMPQADGTTTMVDRWMLDLVPDPRWQLIQVERLYERAVASLDAPDMLSLSAGPDEPPDHEEGAETDNPQITPEDVRRLAPVVERPVPVERTVDPDTGEILEDGPPPDERTERSSPPTPEEPPPPEHPERGPDRPMAAAQPAPPRPQDDPTHPRPLNPDAATVAQVRAIYMAGRDNLSLGQVEVDQRAIDRFGVGVGSLTKRQASEFITELKPGRPATARPQSVAGGAQTAVAPSTANGRSAEQLLGTFLGLRDRVGRINRAFALAIPLVANPAAGTDADKMEELIRQQLFRSIYALEALAPTTAATAPTTNPTTEEAGRYHAALVAEAAASRSLDPDTLGTAAA